ncbi:MAG: serine/threonine-protein phosphatase [Clostridium sp.]|jgi:serine/threonine protein phosphatase PrpC|nr:serine/threonine-protein phosphatase [Clostridium sp.]
MQIETAFFSYQGGRDYNEDSVRCVSENGACAVVVADGLGGHGGGQIASAIVVDRLTDDFMRTKALDTAYVTDLFRRVNAQVLEAQTPTQRMKSTGVALYIKDQSLLWGHVGDTRLYYFQGGMLVSQTLDHSVSQMAVYAGEITVEQIRHHADRSRVLRAFGMEEGFRTEFSRVLTLSPGFHAFLLCTDGFWEYVWETEMASDLAKATSPHNWLETMKSRLLKRVPKDNDNYSAAAVFIHV